MQLKEEYTIDIPIEEILSFLAKISDNDNEIEGMYCINYELFQRCLDRLNKQLQLMSTIEKKPDKELKEKELINYLTEISEHDDGFLIFRNITNDLYKSFEEFIKNFDDFIGDKQINERISLDIDDIKAKLKENEIYINEFSAKENERYQKLIQLKDYINKLEGNTKYLEEKVNYSINFESQKSKTIDSVSAEEYDRIIDENHKLRDIINYYKNENEELSNKNKVQTKEAFDLQSELNIVKSDLLTFKIDCETLSKLNNDYKLELELYLEHFNSVTSHQALNESNPSSPIRQCLKSGSPVRNIKFNDLSKPGYDMSPIGSPLRKIMASPLMRKNSVKDANKKEIVIQLKDNILYKDMSPDQKSYFDKIESLNKVLSEKLTSYEKSQSFYEQRLYILEKENGRLKDQLNIKDNHSKMPSPNTSVNEWKAPLHNPLQDLSAIGNESLMIVTEQSKENIKSSPSKSIRSYIENEGNFNLNLNNLNSDEYNNNNDQNDINDFESNPEIKKLLFGSNEAIKRLSNFEPKELMTRSFGKLKTEENGTPQSSNTPIQSPSPNKRNVYTTFTKKPSSTVKLSIDNNFSIQYLSEDKTKSDKYLYTENYEINPKSLTDQFNLEENKIIYDEYLNTDTPKNTILQKLGKNLKKSIKKLNLENINKVNKNAIYNEITFRSKNDNDSKDCSEENYNTGSVTNNQEISQPRSKVQEVAEVHYAQDLAHDLDSNSFVEEEDLAENAIIPYNNYCPYDYLELEYNPIVIKIIESNHENIKDMKLLKLFSDNIELYDERSLKIIPQCLVVTSCYLYILEQKTSGFY